MRLSLTVVVVQQPDIGSLRVIKKSSTSAPATYLTIQGGQGSVWTEARVMLGLDRDFEVIFEVENGAASGYVAVDDVTFTGCDDQSAGHSCTYGQFTCASGECVDSHQVCDLQADCGDSSDEAQCQFDAGGSCTFDGDVFGGAAGCRYTQYESDNYDWSVGSAVVSSARAATLTGAGPSQDHTPGTEGGSFAYVDVKTWIVGNVATFATGDTFPASENLCAVRFFYFVSGTDTSAILRVYVRSAAAGSRHLAATFVGTTSADAGRWNFAYVPLASGADFRVEFEAEAGGGASTYGGVIAVDDVTFNEECASGSSPAPPATPCQSDQFSCPRNDIMECLPSSWKCDGYADCDDAFDEQGCQITPPPDQTTPHQDGNVCKPNQVRTISLLSSVEAFS